VAASVFANDELAVEGEDRGTIGEMQNCNPEENAISDLLDRIQEVLLQAH
jgi:hypothetical protein